MLAHDPKHPDTIRRTSAVHIPSDLVVVGGGLAGVCCAVTAAREGLRVTLVQDRPVLGGNSSSEVRLWVLGATSHMGNNNRWAREGGVIDEILVENLYRNPEGNPVLFDSVVLELVINEPNIRLLLNTAVHELELTGPDRIGAAVAFNSQNQTAYRLEAPLFVDASGDGILGFLAGAEFRMGAEAAAEFNEGMAPAQPAHTLLGHSLYFYSRDTGKPVKYVPPAFALDDITKIPRFRDFSASDTGCRLWWLEYGGDLDTVAKTEEIKWELWRVAYGVWNYIKNSGLFPESETLTLEWMGSIPGKRESRRFVGDYMLTQRDIVEQREFPDAVSYGGWAIDLHPSEGVYSPEPGCTQWHAKGVYQIPYRTLYSRSVSNLFLAGRIISATHIAFGSTRVMGTCAHSAQAVGMAAAICLEQNLAPRDLHDNSLMHELQQRLLRRGQHIPGVRHQEDADLARLATVTASSSFQLSRLTSSGELTEPGVAYGLLLPVAQGAIPQVMFTASVEHETEVSAELWTSQRRGNTTPDLLLGTATAKVSAGTASTIALHFDAVLEHDAHVLITLPPVPGVRFHLSQDAVPGVLTLTQKLNAAVAKSAVQSPPKGSGIDTFPFWLPERRPQARNLAVLVAPAIDLFGAEMVVNGFHRPWEGVNAWVPAPGDAEPWIELRWTELQTIREIGITLDTDFDNPMESVLLSHAERVMPGCVRSFRIEDQQGSILATVPDNHQTRWTHRFAAPAAVSALRLVLEGWGDAPPAVFSIYCR